MFNTRTSDTYRHQYIFISPAWKFCNKPTTLHLSFSFRECLMHFLKSIEEKASLASGGVWMELCLASWWDQLLNWQPLPRPRNGWYIPRYMWQTVCVCVCKGTLAVSLLAKGSVNNQIFQTVAQSKQLAHGPDSRHGQRRGCGDHHDAIWCHQHPSL